MTAAVMHVRLATFSLIVVLLISLNHWLIALLSERVNLLIFLVLPDREGKRYKPSGGYALVTFQGLFETAI